MALPHQSLLLSTALIFKRGIPRHAEVSITGSHWPLASSIHGIASYARAILCSLVQAALGKYQNQDRIEAHDYKGFQVFAVHFGSRLALLTAQIGGAEEEQR